MTSAGRKGSLPLLPETLLVPLLDAAADVLRGLDSDEVPSSLRPVAGFDRRGLARGAARQQLLRAIETDQSFREGAEQQFRERPEVAKVLEAWDPYNTFDIVKGASARADLPLLASMLYALRPRGWRFGLGVVSATFERQRVDQEKSEERKANDTQIAGLAESRRRAESARVAAEKRGQQLEEELRAERQGRRDREERAAQAAAAAEQQVKKIERELESMRASLEATEARFSRESERARTAEGQLREVERTRSTSNDGAAGTTQPVSADLPVLRREDLRALIDAADLAGRLAAGLSGVAEQARRVLRPQTEDNPAPAQKVSTPAAGGRERPARPPTADEPTPLWKAPTPPPAGRARPARRAQAKVPPGMVEDDPDVLDLMLRTPRTRLVVDGYNVSMLAWGDASPAEQRERLVDALSELQLRTRTDVTVVFDGADVEGVRPPQRRGVHVVFSPAGEEADSVVVREASGLPSDVPVIVASSDNWVIEHARQADARVVSSAALLRALRR
jgi:predicted RNA-binding protein with PIN domain